MEFKELTEERRRVQDLCRKHVPSLFAFKYSEGPSFKIKWNDPEQQGDEVHHLTSTATCIESLRDCHPTLRHPGSLKQFAQAADISKAIDDLTPAFYLGALKRKSWLSEKSAPLYCACRALPLFLEASDKWEAKHAHLVGSIYRQLRDKDEARFGIGEKVIKPKKMTNPKKVKRWYPENAYHTYWALRVLDIVSARPQAQPQKLIGSNLEHQKQGMRLWAKAKLAEEVALHTDKSATLDSDQLTWALTTFIRYTDNLSSDLRAQDLIRKAFGALTKTQEPDGSWRHYAPLFVYSDVGNAYCYVYESFTYLLKAVLEKFGTQEFFEQVMGAFVHPLQKLRGYIEITQVQHPDPSKNDAVGWSSGHRPVESDPEGWATASVFSFLQTYRRLLGLLANRWALRELRPPVVKTPENPVGELIKRGDTWLAAGKTGSAAEQLISLFVYPTRIGQERNPSEPDDQPIGELQARSAILFGPPGTSKTTLARCVAQALGWRYVELHSSHFVADGIGAIQRTADKIFAFLMELDHTVVLFDEPDELVREREGSPDAFGRFLTTSMLPKLAELWKQRRIIYFVATNHIDYFDGAIIRSERFDVVVSVPPPSFKRKMDELTTHLKGMAIQAVSIQVSQQEIEAKLDEIRKLASNNRASASKDKPWPGNQELEEKLQLAKFVLLRWDQIEELACRLASRVKNSGSLNVDAGQLAAALGEVADLGLSKLQAYVEYLEGLRYARRDFQRRPVFLVRLPLPDNSVEKLLVNRDKQFYLVCQCGDRPQLTGYNIEPTNTPGEVSVLRSA